MNEPYDPPAHAGGSNRFSTASEDGLLPNAAKPGSVNEPDEQQRKMNNIRTELDNTKTALEATALKIQERGEIMHDLQAKTDNLSIASRSFKTEGRKVHRKMWWKNAKWTICLTILLILIIVGAVVGGVKGSEVVKEKVIVHETPSATLLPGSGTNAATGTQVSTTDISKASNA